MERIALLVGDRSNSLSFSVQRLGFFFPDYAAFFWHVKRPCIVVGASVVGLALHNLVVSRACWRGDIFPCPSTCVGAVSSATLLLTSSTTTATAPAATATSAAAATATALGMILGHNLCFKLRV
jgi:hypothetical protein